MKIYEIRGSGRPRKFANEKSAMESLKDGEELYEIDVDVSQSRGIAAFATIKRKGENRVCR